MAESGVQSETALLQWAGNRERERFYTSYREEPPPNSPFIVHGFIH